MELYLMRHGEAEPRAVNDAQRALTPYGREQARCVAAGLLGDSVGFDRILCSPYLRAQQTAEALLPCLNGDGLEREPGLTPDADPAALLDRLAPLAGERVLLVSHMPLLGLLAGLLLDGRPRNGPGFDTAGLLALELDVPAAGVARRRWYRRSDEWGAAG